MDQRTVLVGIALALLAGISAWFYMRHRRSRLLRERFGPEYERVVRQEGNVRRGEGVLEFREKKRETLHIRPLSAASRADFSNRWNDVQAQFVGDPEGSVTKADGLVSEVMEAHGYPVVDFAERADIISVDHPVVVENYRAAQPEWRIRTHRPNPVGTCFERPRLVRRHVWRRTGLLTGGAAYSQRSPCYPGILVYPYRVFSFQVPNFPSYLKTPGTLRTRNRNSCSDGTARAPKRFGGNHV